MKQEKKNSKLHVTIAYRIYYTQLNSYEAYAKNVEEQVKGGTDRTNNMPVAYYASNGNGAIQYYY